MKDSPPHGNEDGLAWPRELTQLFTSRFEALDEHISEDNKPVILEYPTSTIIAETLLRELETELLYEHIVGDAITHRAWELSETSSAVIIEMSLELDETTRTHYSLVNISEALLDLRWWLVPTREETLDMNITALENEDVIMTDLLSNTPSEWRPAVEQLIKEATE